MIKLYNLFKMFKLLLYLKLFEEKKLFLHLKILKKY